VQLLITPDGTGEHGCVALWDSSNSFYLANDANTAWTGMVDGKVANSRCTLYGSPASSAYANGNVLTVNFRFSFKSAFAGWKTVYGIGIHNCCGISSGWQPVGSWNVLNPWVKTLSPSSGSAASAVLTTVVNDTGGTGAINNVEFLLTPDGSGNDACLVLWSKGNKRRAQGHAGGHQSRTGMDRGNHKKLG
jgi:hypothetical protein